MRHARAERGDWSIKDFDRSLDERGMRDASSMSGFALGRMKGLKLVLCSPAERAKQTATLFLAAGGEAPPVVYDERIYEASAGRLLRVVRELTDETQEVLLVGHNPGMSELLKLLTNEVSPMSAGALASIALDVEKWSEARDGCGQLEWFASPRMIIEKE